MYIGIHSGSSDFDRWSERIRCKARLPETEMYPKNTSENPRNGANVSNASVMFVNAYV